MFFVTILVILFSLFLPCQAFAWGAGVHIEIGTYLLDNAHLFPNIIQSLLLAHPHDFLYGCISADITVGKRFTHHLNHCHAWTMGKKILAVADTPAQKACAYGYLAHLAADTISHSYFVPFKMVRTFNRVLLKHTYWEIRFESQVDKDVWKLAKKIAAENFHHNDAMLQSVLSETIFSFKTNKRIFNSILLLSRLRHWQKMLMTLSNSSRWVLDKDSQDEYLSLAKDASISILRDLDNSPFLDGDPTGKNAIAVAKKIRKRMLRQWIEGSLSDAQAEHIIKTLRPLFRERINAPQKSKELLQILM